MRFDRSLRGSARLRIRVRFERWRSEGMASARIGIFFSIAIGTEFVFSQVSTRSWNGGPRVDACKPTPARASDQALSSFPLSVTSCLHLLLFLLLLIWSHLVCFLLLTCSVFLAYFFCFSCSFIVLPLLIHSSSLILLFFPRFILPPSPIHFLPSLIQIIAITPAPTSPATAYAPGAGIRTAAFLVDVLLRYAWMLYLLARLENAQVA
jgi:hypothetical protein